MNRLTSSVLFSVTTSFQEIPVPGSATHVVFQSRAPVRIVWGTEDTAYFTYDVMAEPVILPNGFRIRAESGTVSVVVMGLDI